MNWLACLAIDINKKMLSSEEIEYISKLPLSVVFPEWDLTMAHGSISDVWSYIDDESTATDALE